jgi:hypothetical protein
LRQSAKRVNESALAANGIQYSYWDLAANPQVPESYLAAHTNVIWFTGNAYPAPLGPYENELAAFLDGGGRLMMSGQDILDQAAGTTPFVWNYLHVDWNGTEVQNDKSHRGRARCLGQPAHGRHHRCAAEPRGPRRQLRGSDHADRAGHAGLHGRHGSRLGA